MTKLQIISFEEQIEAAREDFNKVYREKKGQMRELGVEPGSTMTYAIAWLFFVAGQESTKRKMTT